MSKGTKRASPGATEEKENPLQGIELSDEDAQKLNDIQKATQRIEIWVGESGLCVIHVFVFSLP